MLGAIARVLLMLNVIDLNNTKFNMNYLKQHENFISNYSSYEKFFLIQIQVCPTYLLLLDTKFNQI